MRVREKPIHMVRVDCHVTWHAADPWIQPALGCSWPNNTKDQLRTLGQVCCEAGVWHQCCEILKFKEEGFWYLILCVASRFLFCFLSVFLFIYILSLSLIQHYQGEGHTPRNKIMLRNLEPGCNKRGTDTWLLRRSRRRWWRRKEQKKKEEEQEEDV